MVILRRKTKKKEVANTSLVGAVLPIRLATYLTIYCVANGKSKSSILKELLTAWVEKMELQQPIDSLIEQIAIRSYTIWKLENKRSFSDFKSSLKNELHIKGLDIFADEIINKLTNEKEKNK